MKLLYAPMNVNDLPKFPEGRDLEITDYHLIVPRLHEFKLYVSEYNFTNIFAWRNAYKYKISELEGAIITHGVHEEKPFMLPPIGDPKHTANIAYEALQISHNSGNKITLAVAPEWLEKMMCKMPNLEIKLDPSNFDYVYKSSDLAELPGPKYHAKRNLIRQFQNNNEYQIEDLNTSTCAEAIEYADRWCEKRDCESDEGLKKEKCAIYQMLTHFEGLRLHGIVLRVGGEIVGLAMGEELDKNTYVVHVEKGDHHLRGIYQLINQELTMRIAPKYKYINREQDLGVPGLRRAKESYYPDHMVKKYMIKYSEES